MKDDTGEGSGKDLWGGGAGGGGQLLIHDLFIYLFIFPRRKDLWGVERESADSYFVLKRRARRALLTCLSIRM